MHHRIDTGHEARLLLVRLAEAKGVEAGIDVVGGQHGELEVLEHVEDGWIEVELQVWVESTALVVEELLDFGQLISFGGLREDGPCMRFWDPRRGLEEATKELMAARSKDIANCLSFVLEAPGIFVDAGLAVVVHKRA